MTEGQINEALHIALIVALTLATYVQYLIHSKLGDVHDKLDEASDKLDKVVNATDQHPQ